MAYWRNYRKFSAEASAVANAESSDEDCQNEQHHNETSFVEGFPGFDSSDLDNELGYSSGTSSDEEHQSGSSEGDCSNSQKSFNDELASWATKYQVQRAAVNDLLALLKKQGHALPKDARTLLGTPKEVTVLSKCGGQYIYFGIKHGITQVLSAHPGALENGISLELIINIDGLPLFKSSNDQFWPILGSFNNLDVFVIGLYYGKTKPSSLEEYMDDFLQELDALKKEGITFGSKTYKVELHCFSCDAPSRCFLKAIIGHTGYFSCERCQMKGSWKGRVVFNSGDIATLRTEEAFANYDYEAHQKRQTPLICHGVSCINGFALDYMHMVCLGVTRRILHFLKKGPRECKLSSVQLAQISANLLSLKGKMPSEFARQPRSLDELERWKATEFRQFLLYTGPIALKGVVSTKLYQHFLSLSIAISIMLESNADRRNSLLNYARQLMQFFVKNCKAVYGETFTVYNVHGLLHLHEDVSFFQCSLNEISCFQFENFLQKLKKLVRSGGNPLVQVAKRLGEITVNNPKCSVKQRFTVISTKEKDRCFLLADRKFAFVKEVKENGTLVCDTLSERQTQCFFETPAQSKLFSIAYARDITQGSKRQLVERDDLVCKVVCLPCDAGYVLYPLLHEVERT